MLRKSLLGGFLLFFVIQGFPSASLGFDSVTRKLILADALRFCPDELRIYLEGHKNIVSQGISFADTSHGKLKPEDFQDLFTYLVERLKAGASSQYNTINKFGVLACYLSESIYPGDLRISMKNTVARYDGFHEVSDPRTKLLLLTEEYGPYRGDRRKEVTDFLYNTAVNEIVDLWISAWKAGGGETTRLCRVGLEIKHNPSYQNTDESKEPVRRELTIEEHFRLKAEREFAQEKAERAKAEEQRLAAIAAEEQKKKADQQKEREEALIRKLKIRALTSAAAAKPSQQQQMQHILEQQQQMQRDLNSIDWQLQQQRWDNMNRDFRERMRNLGVPY